MSCYGVNNTQNNFHSSNCGIIEVVPMEQSSGSGIS